MAKQIKIEDDHIIVSSSRLCSIMGISDRTLSTWSSEGCPKYSRGWFDLEEVMKWRGMVGGIKGKGTKEMSLQEQKMRAEVQLKGAQAEIAEFKHAINAGRYLERAFVETELRRFFTIFRRSVSVIPRRMAGMLATYIDPMEARRAERQIAGQLEELLAELSVGGVFDGKESLKDSC